jgi:hypothetical protein
MPCRPHPPCLDHYNYTWRTVQVMELLIMQFSPASYHFIPLRSKYSPPDKCLNIKTAVFYTCFHAGFLLGLFFDPEDGGDMILRNVG